MHPDNLIYFQGNLGLELVNIHVNMLSRFTDWPEIVKSRIHPTKDTHIESFTYQKRDTHTHASNAAWQVIEAVPHKDSTPANLSVSSFRGSQSRKHLAKLHCTLVASRTLFMFSPEADCDEPTGKACCSFRPSEYFAFLEMTTLI